MAVNLSPVGGVAAQFFDNDGNVLSGGLIYTYVAGTSTPTTTYTTAAGNIPHSNPIVLDSGGRVPTGEIWLTDGVLYKFVLKDSGDALIATYDNISGINSNAVAYTNQQEIITATAGQTVFDLTITYAPGTNSLSVFVDGVNQYGPGAQYAYIETDGNTVTFNSGLHVGAEVKFTSTQQQGAGATDASQVTYDPPFTGSAVTNVELKLAQTVSVKDFGAAGNGTTDDTTALQSALNSGADAIYVPEGTYLVSTQLAIPSNVMLYGDGAGSVILATTSIIVVGVTGTSGSHKSGAQIKNLKIRRTGNASTIQLVEFTYADDCYIQNVIFDGGSSTYPGSFIGYSVNQLQIVSCQFIGGSACQLTSYGVVAGNPWSTNCVIKDCYMSAAAHQGFDFYYVQNLIVDGCIAHGRTSTYGCGFIIEYQATNVTFTNCISYSNTRSGFYYEPNTAYGIATVVFNNCISYSNGEAGLYAQNSFGLVVNGGAYWGSTTSFTGSNGGISLVGNNLDCVVSGAYIHSNQVAGLTIESVQGASITGNNFYNNNGPALNFTSTSQGVVVEGNSFNSNNSIASGWVENQTGIFPNYAWTAYTPTVYSNDGTTTVSISNSSVKYKRIGSTCFVEGYFEFSGSANNSIMYVSMPFTGNWTNGSTGAAAKMMRGTARSSSTGMIYMDGLYYNTRLAINGMGVSDTNVRFTASFEIA